MNRDQTIAAPLQGAQMMVLQREMEALGKPGRGSYELPLAQEVTFELDLKK